MSSYLPRHNPIREIAENLLAGQKPRSVTPLFTALGDRTSSGVRERSVAAWAVGRAPLDETERHAAIDMLRGILARKRRSSNLSVMSKVLGGCGVAFIFVLFFGFFTTSVYGPDIPLLLMLGGFFIFVFSCIVALANMLIPSSDKVRLAAVTSLANLGQPEAITEVAIAYHDRDHHLKLAAASALHELLPKLTDYHYGVFSPATVANLANALDTDDHLLAIKILNALEKIGTPGVIPAVERVASNGRGGGLCTTAERVLVTLRARKEVEKQAKTLVRPASPPTQQSLLRPASAVTNTPEEQLLRPRDDAE